MTVEQVRAAQKGGKKSKSRAAAAAQKPKASARAEEAD